MAHEILTPDEMAEADRRTIAGGVFDGWQLMRRAGAAVAGEVLARWGDRPGADIVCGPGNNGGDGYAAARLLAERGWPVRLFAEGPPRAGSDAERARAECPLPAAALADFRPDAGRVVIDALYGAGLSRPLEGAAAAAVRSIAEAKPPVVAVDLPSGVSGATGQVLGCAAAARLTVTFARRKPGHLLYPGRGLCGEVVVADIGIGDAVIGSLATRLVENRPAGWRSLLPRLEPDTHKYRRGHVGVFSGGPSSTGAARLSALAAARAGAGAVTVLSPASAMQVNAMHLTSVMLRRVDGPADAVTFVGERKLRAAVLGPGFGVGEKLRKIVLALLEMREGAAALVLDADAITAFAEAPASLFIAAGDRGAPPLVLTPHEGEFARLFCDLARDTALSKVERARKAAARAHGAVVLKGADTVIAAPDGRAAINANAAPWLATAGSGDVLAGIIASLTAQGMPPFEAACAAAWLHAEAGSRFGPGLIAEDLPGLLPGVLRELLGAS